MRFEQFSNVSQACVAGLGIALMPLFLISAEIESGQLVVAYEHTVKSPSSYYFVTPQARANTPAVKAFAIGFLLRSIESSILMPSSC